MNNYIHKNRKKVLILSHILLVMGLMNMAFKLYIEDFANNLYFNILLLVVMVICFIVVQVQLAERD